MTTEPCRHGSNPIAAAAGAAARDVPQAPARAAL